MFPCRQISRGGYCEIVGGSDQECGSFTAVGAGWSPRYSTDVRRADVGLCGVLLERLGG